MNDKAKGHNVVAAVVVPSIIDTPQNPKAMPDAVFDNWVKPEAIADTIYFYCTREADTMGAGDKGLQQSISRLIVGFNIKKCCKKFFCGIFYFSLIFYK